MLSKALFRVALACALMLLISSLSCASASHKRASKPASEPDWPTGNGWYCFHALPPSTTPAGLTFSAFDYSSLCARSQHECERIRAGVVKKHDKLPARLEWVRADRAITPDDNRICAIDPSACPVPDRHEQVEPAGYSACDPKPAAACTAYYHEFNWYRPGDPTWRFTCLETEAECGKYIDGWKIHIVESACVSLR